jgi:Uma2 family endonuclease
MAMSTEIAAYREAVDHLPPGGMLVFQHVTWEEYEQLLEDLSTRPGVRVSYDEGRLEIMSPLPEHEEYKDSIYSMVRVFCEVRGIELETRGSATWKRSKLQKGSEPDTCFYVANAARIIGRRTIDLDRDPPPDVVVEIDSTNESISKFSIYAALRVPEIWRYDGERSFMYRRKARSYSEVPASLSFPGLTPNVVTAFLDDAKSRGQTKALQAFRKRIQVRKPRPRKAWGHG